MDENSSIEKLKGVGKKTQQLFNKLNIYTLSDLVKYYPRDYEIFNEPIKINQIEQGKICAVTGSIVNGLSVNSMGKKKTVTGFIKDDTGQLQVLWFNMVFLRTILKRNMTYIFYGNIVKINGNLIMEQSKYFTHAQYKELMKTMRPVYDKTEGLSNNTIVKAIRQTLDNIDLSKDYLPNNIIESYDLPKYSFAVNQIHFPESKEKLILARKRIVFDEFFLFILRIRKLKKSIDKEKSIYNIKDSKMAQDFRRSLPYELTAAQKKVWKEIQTDMASGKIMRRLVQGDVGSGKTVIAILALISVCENGYQGAMMAPTEVLARQHYDSICKMFEQYGIKLNVELLTGSTKRSEKRRIYEAIEIGSTDIIIGTHALIQEKSVYKNLALVITDEQHRFGVNQREMLSKKGMKPHVIVMSATPIPRTLAIIIYGDLDISVIDELPGERIPIKSCVVGTKFRNKSYELIQKEVSAQRQAYVICPLVEESESIEAVDVISYSKRLKEYFKNKIKIEYLHGKMNNDEKNEIMERFAVGETKVLVSTTVIEVGINVPNATVIIIENAERFGLAQLHQLRGRVGRGKHQSYCVLISGNDSEKTRERLDILNKSNDGFYIASQDLKQRGTGDMFGVRQSGFMEFGVADIFEDSDMLAKASDAATAILEKDNELELFEHILLRKKMETLITKETAIDAL